MVGEGKMAVCKLRNLFGFLQVGLVGRPARRTQHCPNCEAALDLVNGIEIDPKLCPFHVRGSSYPIGMENESVIERAI